MGHVVCAERVQCLAGQSLWHCCPYVIIAKLDLKPNSGPEVAWEGLTARGNCLDKSPGVCLFSGSLNSCKHV